MTPLLIELEFARVEQGGDPFAFRFAPQDYLLRRAGGGFDSARFMWDETLLADLAAVRRPGRDPALLQRLGETLRRFLSPAGWSDIESQLIGAVQAGRRVVLTIRSAAAELYALPWELLTLRATGQHVGEIAGVLLRYEWPECAPVAEEPRLRSERARILLAWSAAGGAVPAAEHLAALQAASRAGFCGFEPSRDVLPHASCQGLEAALHAAEQEGGVPIAVLHILCHGAATGSTFGLALDSGPGSESADDITVVDAGRLRQLLGRHAAMLRLVVLVACDTGNSGALGNQLGSLAQTLHRAGIAAVVASRYPLSAAGSVQLTSALYHGLLANLDSLEGALLAARQQLALDAEQLDWASLQLYAHSATGANTRPVVFRPYRGLLSFGPEHRRFFFGRDAEVAAVRASLSALRERQQPRFLIVAGASGTGKSSLVLAKLVPDLCTKEGWQAQVVRAAGEGPAMLESLLVARGTSPHPLLLVVDQFEEIFTLLAPRARSAFVQRLWQLACDPHSGITVLTTLRVDYLGQGGEVSVNPDEPGRRLDAVAYTDAHRIFVAQFGPLALRQSIEGPAAQVGLELEQGLTDRLLTDVGSEPGALPLLEYTLDQLWQRRHGHTLTQAAYQELGGVSGALSKDAERLIQALDAEQKKAARRLLVALVSVAAEHGLDTRQQRRVAELRPSAPAAALIFDEVVDALVNTRLLVRGSDHAAPTLEIAHESLIRSWRRLRRWVDGGRADRRFRDRTAEAARLWEDNGHLAGRLWRSPDLDTLRTYNRHYPEELGPTERKFLQASESNQRKEWWVRRLAVSLMLFAALLVAGIYGMQTRQMRGTLLSMYSEQGRRLLVEEGNPNEALLWLHRAYARHSMAPMLPFLLRDAMRGVDVTKLLLTKQRGTDASYSPDGRRILSMSADGTINEYDSSSGRLLRRLAGPERAVTAASYCADGRRIITPNNLGELLIWNGNSGELESALKVPRVVDAALSPDGHCAVLSGGEAMAQIWDLNTGKILHELKSPGNVPIISARYNPSGNRVVTTLSNGIVVWDVETASPLFTLKDVDAVARTVTYSPDGSYLIAACKDHTVRIWNAQDGSLLNTFASYPDAFHSARFGPDSRSIVTAGEDHTVRVWSLDSKRPIVELRGHGEQVNSAVFSPNGREVLSASEDGTVRVWDLAQTDRRLVMLTGHQARIVTQEYSPEGGRILTASLDHTARIWDADSGRPLVTFSGHAGALRGATFSPDGLRVVTASEDGTARIWDAASGRMLAELVGHKKVIYTAKYSPDGRRIVTASEDGTVRIWDASCGRQLALVQTESPISSATYSPDGHTLITTGTTQKTRIWDAGTGSMRTELDDSFATPGMQTAQYAPSGQYIVTTSGTSATVWDARTGRKYKELPGHQGLIDSVAYGPEGLHILTTSIDKTARLWDAETGQLLAAFRGHPKGLQSAMYSPQGDRMLTVGSDGTVHVWDSASEQMVADLKSTAPISCATYSPDGRRILVADNLGNANLWDVAQETRTPAEIGDLLRCYVPMRFASPDSSVLISVNPEPEHCQGVAPTSSRR